MNRYKIKVHHWKKLKFALIGYGKMKGDLKGRIKPIGPRQRCDYPFPITKSIECSKVYQGKCIFDAPLLAKKPIVRGGSDIHKEFTPYTLSGQVLRFGNDSKLQSFGKTVNI